jgi:hypothetical protein
VWPLELARLRPAGPRPTVEALLARAAAAWDQSEAEARAPSAPTALEID